MNEDAKKQLKMCRERGLFLIAGIKGEDSPQYKRIARLQNFVKTNNKILASETQL
jgi:ribosomal protein S18